MSVRTAIRFTLDALRRFKLRNLPPFQSKHLYAADAPRLRVLVIGVYLADRKNTAASIARECSNSLHFEVTQHWAAIGKISADPYLASITSEHTDERVPRSIMLNRLLAHEALDTFEYIIACDDDVVIRRGFIDLYLGLQTAHKLSLAQPARTKNSWIDHLITQRVDGVECRYTRFVEIGPVFSIHRRLFKYLLPLDVTSAMGWGLDFVWPTIVEAQGLHMGIIDAAPVDHSMRQPKTGYVSKDALAAMEYLWSIKPHLTVDEAQVTLNTVPLRSK